MISRSILDYQTVNLPSKSEGQGDNVGMGHQDVPKQIFDHVWELQIWKLMEFLVVPTWGLNSHYFPMVRMVINLRVYILSIRIPY